VKERKVLGVKTWEMPREPDPWGKKPPYEKKNNVTKRETRKFAKPTQDIGEQSSGKGSTGGSSGNHQRGAGSNSGWGEHETG